MEECSLSCADCGSAGCINSTGNYPAFCTTARLAEGELEEALAAGNLPENQKVLKAATPGWKRPWNSPAAWAFTKSASPPPPAC